MSDTQRTRAQILSLFAENVTGQVSTQDLRDFVVTVMETEFVNPGDFWKTPDSRNITTDKTGKGDKLYSQIVGSDCSFMNIMAMNNSGLWIRADIADSALNGGQLAVAMDSYTSNDSTTVMLLRGILYDSSFSTIFSQLIGRPIYLDSGVPGSISVGSTDNSVKVIGYICNSEGGNSATGKWYFESYDWGVKGS